MTNHERRGLLRRLSSGLGAALRRGLLGKSSHEHMKQFGAGDEYWDRVIAAQRGWPLQQRPNPDTDQAQTAGTVPSPQEPEYEPVHGWSRRQLDDYLRRNPDYRLVYQAMLRKCGNSAPPGNQAPEGIPAVPGAAIATRQPRVPPSVNAGTAGRQIPSPVP